MLGAASITVTVSYASPVTSVDIFVHLKIQPYIKPVFKYPLNK